MHDRVQVRIGVTRGPVSGRGGRDAGTVAPVGQSHVEGCHDVQVEGRHAGGREQPRQFTVEQPLVLAGCVVEPDEQQPVRSQPFGQPPHPAARLRQVVHQAGRHDEVEVPARISARDGGLFEGDVLGRVHGRHAGRDVEGRSGSVDPDELAVGKATGQRHQPVTGAAASVEYPPATRCRAREEQADPGGDVLDQRTAGIGGRVRVPLVEVADRGGRSSLLTQRGGVDPTRRCTVVDRRRRRRPDPGGLRSHRLCPHGPLTDQSRTAMALVNL